MPWQGLTTNPKAQVIVVELHDRLMRFGLEYVEAALAAPGRRVVLTASAKPASLEQESAMSYLGRD